MVQNAAVISTKTRTFAHLTPILAYTLTHSLVLSDKTDQVLLMTYKYKILNGHVPSYRFDILKLYILSHALRSVHKVKKKSAGCRAFPYPYCATFLWNNLPADFSPSLLIPLYPNLKLIFLP